MNQAAVSFAIGITGLASQLLILYSHHEAITHQVEKLDQNVQRLKEMEVQLRKHTEDNHQLIRHKLLSKA